MMVSVMNRIASRFALLSLLTLAVASSSFAFDTSKPHRGNRIGVLLLSQRTTDSSELRAASAVRGALTEELRKAGFDAFEVPATYDQLARDSDDADYYVEVISTDGEMHDRGSIDVDDGHVGADVGILVTRVAAQLRLYDGHSLELVDRFDLSHRKVAPTLHAVSVGGRHGFFSMAVPWIRNAQYRGVARDVAGEAASKISATTRTGEEH